MTKLRTGVAIAALLIGVTAAIIWLDRLGKAASPAAMPEWMKAEITDPARAIYEITMPDGVFRLTTPHALTLDDLNAIVAAMCKAITCEVKAYQNDAPATEVAK